MLGSPLALLAVASLVLLVPAFAVLLAAPRHRHVAPGEDSLRWVRLAVAATVVALAGLGVAALLGADAFLAAVVAVVLAGSVLVWGPVTRTWAVRGVVMWALLVAAAVGVLGWLVQQVVASAMSGTEIAVTAGVTLVLLAVVGRGHGLARDVIGAQAGLGPRALPAQRIPVLRPLVSLAVLLAAGGVVLAVTSDDSGTPERRPPQAGRSGPASGPPQPSTGSAPTIAGSPEPPVTDQAPAALAGTVPALAPAAPLVATTGELSTALATLCRSAAARAVAGSPQAPGATRPAVPARTAAPPRHAGAGSGATVGDGRHPVTRPSRGPVPSDKPPSREPTSEPTPKPTPKPSPRPTEAPTSAPSHAPTPPPPPTEAPPPPTRPVKTPGYAKENPHRPSSAPSPGHGRDNRTQGALPPLSRAPSTLPSLAPKPRD